MPIASSLLVSKGETRTHQILEKYNYIFKIFPKVRFFDIVDWNTPGISPREHQYLEKTHFDFVICTNNSPYKPLFAVEFDGIGANISSIDPWRNLKKETKLRICHAETFPVLWIEEEEITDLGGETILDAILSHYIIYSSRYGADIQPGEGPVYIFPPTVDLLEKYTQFIGDMLIDKIEQTPLWTSVTRRIEVNTIKGKEYISRTIRLRPIHFPHFHSVELADDIATYECIAIFEKKFRQGHYILD